MSSIPGSFKIEMELKPSFIANSSAPESSHIQQLISTLNMIPHIEGGFFAETDRATSTMPSPFLPSPPTTTTALAPSRPGFNPAIRSTSTSIFYLLTPNSPQGGFHRNKARTIHTLHSGRGRYVLVHADEEGMEKRIESFVVGHDVAKGEKLQWVVEGGKFKASYLLPDEEGGEHSNGLLISETVVPGFEYCDHDFLREQDMEVLLGRGEADRLRWLLSPLGRE